MDSIEQHCKWLRIARRKESTTIRQRRGALRRLAAALGVDDPLHASGPDLLAWQESCAHLSAQSMATYLSHVRSYYAWAVESDLRETDPSARLVRPVVPRPLPRPIPHDRLMLALAGATPRIGLALLLAATAGLRAKEIAGVNEAHILRDSGQLLVLDGKGDHQRLIPLRDVTTQALDAAPRSPAGWFFPALRGGGVRGHASPASISTACNRHLRACGIPDTLHSLRHRFGTELYRASPDLRMVQEIMGHSSPNTTARYVAHNNEAAARAVAAMRGVA